MESRMTIIILAVGLAFWIANKVAPPTSHVLETVPMIEDTQPDLEPNQEDSTKASYSVD
ncbi:MAG: hypothetical protein VYC00_03380 [Candidatus Neomarinimicrobiota bacterium]|nr:hypothetical protein [Candidatus Neomarinimicrobiota bacterium]|tara:strand:- start:166 stop:342 length:177 start_codon:yes stop_codon:yes gene_type:complete